LVSRGYLEKLQTQKGYILGRQVAAINGSFFNHQALIDAADPVMNNITRTLKENTLLAVLDGEHRNVIHRKNAGQQVQAHTQDTKKAYDSSTGRLLIAMMSDEAIQHHILRYGLPVGHIWPEANSKKKFFEQVKIIRKKGYALIEDSVQIVGIAAPVHQQGKLVAALSIYMPSFRCDAAIRLKLIKNVLLSAKKISK
jgi:DNA-binding IclR family transcriptional regulator